ncbi:GNAT family N-acetyltransferase [Candidatus Thorarchaeota archaeon]|nr:MAG: GNAT family N-acetyltransferase [Candidatus Thorarchaeota archaeon]
MTYRSTDSKVRDFELNREDAARLAECLNSFDDSDSWPGGFTRGNPFTAERILDDWSKSNSMRVLVAYSGDKIVGHCNIADAELDPEAAYVGLLGVDPEFQKQGFGRDLLIEAAQTAARAGKRRIDLHTWGGNLKAVPLYKKTGYNWVPGTQVLMESHIPGILGSHFFGEFFDRYDWYDVMKVDIRQEVDDFVEEGIGIFKYRFEGENGDLLLVTVDREAKGINSFDLTFDGKRIAASLSPSAHVGYIGLGETEVKLVIESGQESELKYSIKPNVSVSVQFSLEGKKNGEIRPDSVISEKGTMSIEIGATPLNREMNAWEKTKTQVEFVLQLGEKTISLFCGILPVEPISISSGPLAPCMSRGEVRRIDVGFTNNTDDELSGEIRVSPVQDGVCDPLTADLKLKKSNSIGVQIQVDTSGITSPSVIGVNVEVYVHEKKNLKLILRKRVNIPVIGASGAVAYVGLGDYIWLETESFRASLNKNPPMSVRLFEHKVLGTLLDGWGLLPDIGYPFADTGNEWDRKKFNVEIRNNPECAELELSAESIDRPGLYLTVIFRAHPGGGGLEQRVILENRGKEPLKNLGYKVRGWLGYPLNKLYVPLNGDVYCLDSLDWRGGRQLPINPEFFHESWIASVEQDNRMVLGFIWDSDYVDQVRAGRGRMPRVEYRIGDLTPGESVEFSPIRMLITDGPWRKVRQLWCRLNGRPSVPDLAMDARSDVEVEIVSKDTRHVGARTPPVFVDKDGSRELEFRLRVLQKNPISVDVSVEMPSGIKIDGKSKVSFTVDEVGFEKPFSRPFKIEANEDSSWFQSGGSICLEFASRVVHEPLTVVVYDSGLSVERTRFKVEQYNVFKTIVGNYELVASPEHRAGLIRFNLAGETSPFLDTFPDVGPFVWWDRFHSGVSPYLVGYDTWAWEQGFSKEKWTMKEAQVGPWVGYSATMKSKYVPNAKGVQLQARYLTLPGTPLVQLQMRVTNKARLWRRVLFGFRGVPRPGGDKRSIVHTVQDGKKVTYRPLGNETEVFVSTDEPWGALEGINKGEILGVVATDTSQTSLSLNIQGENAQTIGFRKWVTLSPSQTSLMTGYLVLAESVSQVEDLRQLPISLE